MRATPAIVLDPLRGALPSETDAAGEGAEGLVHDALHALREHLGQEVAFVSEFADGRRHFRHVDSALPDPPIRVGASDPLGRTYCHAVVQGLLPRLIRDAEALPVAASLSSQAGLRIGAHLSVPIELSNGEVYGTLCCFSRQADHSLGDRDLGLMQLAARFMAQQIERRLQAFRSAEEARSRIQEMLGAQAYHMVFQPIFPLDGRQAAGFEALTRFAGEPRRSPDVWFAEAARVGLAEALELAVIGKALAELGRLPPPAYLSLNVSPGHILSGAVLHLLDRVPLDRIVLEVTEHVPVDDYLQFAAGLDPLRRLGLRLAVDDAGAGFASFRHVLQLRPDLIKLDIGLTRDIDSDPTRRALASALVRFAAETGSRIVAEGVETQAELETLRALGVHYAQGYLLGRPQPMDQTLPGLPVG
jgi:EAL domain-containing protein (putative c-di-GMP-specific phosphodiesterase class I)